ncbi:MAG: AAA family ATPase [Chromatiaceae bacterium]|nr:AAA family ATPase [Chromatiaceae bacterium]MBP6733162.1 AAA family ATPase [Chromatiaceae bacterium]MBP6806669.1 AAA family ATPase [Chromatiaceae bacterium]MBP8282531.1 AAA family ATPase [Chromatiaceae bacterium]MBP8288290.1 AAA family ATPase [Chromatiaceae bacterium]
MKVSDLTYGRTSVVELARSDGKPFPNTLSSLVEAVLYQQGDDWLLRIGEDGWEVASHRDVDRDTLRGLRMGALHRLCWLAQKTPSQGPPERITLQIHEFVGSHDWDQPVQIGIDDRVVEDMRRQRKQLNSVESLVKWLGEHILIHPQEVGGPVRALLAGSPGAAGGRQVAFRLFGKGFAMDVASDPDDRLRVTRVVSVKRPQADGDARPLYLATGQIAFCDLTIAGQFRGTARDEIAERARQADSYLRLWREYNDLELAGILKRAQDFGVLRYHKCEQRPDGVWRFELDDSQVDAQALRAQIAVLTDGRSDAQLEAGQEIPAAIQSGDLAADQGNSRSKPFIGVPELSGQARRIDLRPSREQEDRTPPKSGYLYLSLGGDKVRMNRRSLAWDAIRGCTSPMPQIGLLIEGAPVPARATRRREPFTQAVRALLPNPTDRQRQALDIALNTPDIALIQGPPGTGKTRVIAALQARLTDKDEVADGSGLAGNTLLTSYQHDAVDNAAAATWVLGLPAIKIGYRKGAQDGGAWLDTWAQATAEQVRAARAERGGGHSIHRALEEVRRLSISHIEAPGPEDTPLTLLNQVRDLAGHWLPGEILNRIDDLRGRLRTPDGALTLADEDRADALKAVRGLRIEAVPFSDDGSATAHRALRCLDRLAGFVLDESTRAILGRAANLDPDEPPPQDLLDGLAELHNALTDRLQRLGEKGEGRAIHADVTDLCGEVVDTLTERARTLPAGVEMAVDGWLEALEHDPDGLRDTIAHYSMVLAATCQQSVSTAMTKAKAGEDMVFHSVIVDEAARANPLDLLIPMALAERRIILVGDHRQLPQLLEPDVERQLRATLDAEMHQALERSLFERLFRELREREQRDGIKRTITLDTQYRMHPILGDFVSNQFYAPHGEALGSGREAADFTHQVVLADGTPLAGRVAAWAQIPRSAGAEDPGRSKRRTCEAERVAREAQTILAGNPDLSVGVITFYAAQRDAILKAMAGQGLTEPDNEVGYRIRDRWARTLDGRECLRVGTVDAFQGKEFDVVLLSLTRSNAIQVNDEATRRKRYGFLLLENRLCVAMSRQRCLLIVVGDLDMVQGDEAEQSVPALAAFAKLCEEGLYGLIVRT